MCKIHGETSFVKRKLNYRCRKCASDAVVRRRRALKLMAIDYKGGKCADCSLVSTVPTVYDFHHEHGKDFNISASGHTRSWVRLVSELDKCTMLCSNCHRIRHYRQPEEHPKRISIYSTVCPRCQGSKSRRSKVCRACSRPKVEWPDRESLLRQIADSSTATVAKNLGVSWNAVRKRLASF